MKKQSIRIASKLAALVAIAGIGAFASLPEAHAGSASANLNVSASISASCSISTSALAFGSYDPLSGSPTDGTGSLSVTCTNGASASLTLGQGLSPDGASTDAAPLRRMSDGTNFMSYSLFQDAGRTTAWGNTAGTGVANTGNGAAQSITVYGRIAAGQNLPAGAYADTVVATVTF